MSDMVDQFIGCRSFTEKLCEGLLPEDMSIQSMDDVSPIKWHLAHTTWFFESMILQSFLSNFQPFNEKYHYLFNSYYKSQGDHLVRGQRGALSRPSCNEVTSYRQWVDEKVIKLLESKTSTEIINLVRIGINHEQQHQELIMMDVKHILGSNPLNIKWCNGEPPISKKIEQHFIKFEQGLYDVGREFGESFCYDNETPKHKVYLSSFALSNKLVSNGEYLEFLESESYQNPLLWLSDGWDTKLAKPLYWVKRNGQWFEKTPYGELELQLDQPVIHVSFFEADAYAKWCGARLPSEAEWEVAANSVEVKGQFIESDLYLPQAGESTDEFYDLFGCLWQWTSSHYETYPGYKRPQGSLGEYNAKFCNNQRVLKGGSFATAKNHYRNSYRNFYQPEKQWPFTGIRLAKDLS